MAQNRMKQQADQGCSERQFVEGDQVFIQLQPYKQNYFKADHCQKLAPKFYGPYTVLKCVRQAKLDEEGSIWLQPKEFLDQHEHHLCQRTIKEVLVQWKDTTPTDATWELATILQQFSHPKPRGNGCF